MKPNFLLSSTVRIAVLLFTIFFFMSQVLPARGKFKEICERPNGSCRDFCLKTEIHVGRCLNSQPCCLPLGHQPRIESTTPKKD
ncbi:beta-defensin 108B-like [Pongo abelii]|uniref:beta-defensin 108B-like n=1 Tax=Pongo abelii TaxID=9601 RepID=UPI0023E7D176|nr:beta-defensin 108B-like [Pongo abelii]XP_054401769.1 beta-defensin 108B-like [Pongo abelii]